MSDPVRKFSFSGGEITPLLSARTDLNKYENGVLTCRNMIPMRHGGVSGRPGTQYIGTTLNGGAAVRLIPFIFNETGLGQSYVLEFGNQYVTFYQNGGNVVSSTKTITGATQANPCVITAATHGFSNGDIIVVTGVLGMTQLNNDYFIVANVTTNTFSLKDLLGNAIDSTAFTAYTSGGTASKIYIVSTPYVQADLATLQFAESADILTIAHPNYAPRELSRSGATSWALNTITLAPTILAPTNPAWSGSAGAAQIAYGISSVNSNGEESLIVQYAGNGAGFIAAATPSTPVTLTWVPAASAVYYKIYFSTTVQSGLLHVITGVWGFLGQSVGASFIDNGITPNYSNSPPISVPGLFGGANDYPSTVGFVQQRRCFANSNNNPIGFWMSQPGDYYNFTVHATTQDSDAIIAAIAGEEVNAIQHILELKFMLLLTAGAELYVQGNGSGVVTPSGINASTQSQYGASPLRPLKVGDVLIFNQALGSFIRDFAFDFSIDGYRGNDVTIFSSHLFENYQLVDWAYQKVPDSLIFAARSDGTLLTCTYVREQQVLAWARHDFTNGLVENVCSIPENGVYSVYLSIKRVINGQTVRYIERVSSRLWTDPIDASYLDSFIKYDGRNTGSTTMTLTGSFPTTSAAYQQQMTLTASGAFFTAAMVGDSIFLQDAQWVATGGVSGTQVRLIIQAYTSSTVVTVTSDTGAVPVAFQGVATTNWARAVKTVAGLGYLQGQEVSVWADRYLVASPLNPTVSSTYTVPASGSITLDKWYSVIFVGLPMTQDIEPMDLETYFGPTILGKRKRVGKVSTYCYNTRSFYAGSQNPDKNSQNTGNDALFQMYEERRGTSTKTFDQPPQLFTDQDYVITPARWNRNGRFFMRNVDPVPWTLLAISAGEEDPSQGPYKRQ